MLGSGFPSTGQKSDKEAPTVVVTFWPLPVADGESKKHKRRRLVNHHGFENISILNAALECIPLFIFLLCLKIYLLVFSSNSTLTHTYFLSKYFLE